MVGKIYTMETGPVEHRGKTRVGGRKDGSGFQAGSRWYGWIYWGHQDFDFGDDNFGLELRALMTVTPTGNVQQEL